ncbi:DUF349 domain-containing protein [Thalassotalea psychrophila]|uniref:DUF349 domain-containing protein n=1 Tax=Thalassotalea psychrophila TaxID=3065647 RepID=A0ABY9TNZ2_9GAMM|nr:DUF349 domain-containing protein [Colwelliaceae bacterium SQ149]
MIFDKFFKAKWQHKDANVRIQAIQEFDLLEQRNVEIIKQLIEHDTSELVCRAALLKLNNVDQFLSCANTHNKLNIRQFAHQRLQLQILEPGNVITASQKVSYLKQCDKASFLESWLMIEHDHVLLQALITKVNKPHSLAQFMVKTDNIDLQREILSDINEISLLEKLDKKLSDGEFKTELVNKLTNLQELAAKPEKIKKQLQLLLSKLLALKDLQDFADMQERKGSLEEEWHTVVADFENLSIEEKQQHLDKYEHIQQQLKKHFAQREEVYLHEQFIKDQKTKQQAEKQAINTEITIISQQISEAVFENTELDEFKVSQHLDNINVQIESSTVVDSEKDNLYKQVKSLHKKLNQLPEVAECVSSATSLISKLSTLAIPATIEELNLRKPVFEQWQQQWQQINDLANDVLPQSIISARDELQSSWSKALKPLVKEQHLAFEHFRKKVSELKRLMANGKYKSAFGLHKKLTYLFNDLSVSQQERLTSDFETVTGKINELHELEAFVVTPRKQEMLAEIKALVEQPLDNPTAQAEQVKTFRKHWNSLGHADELLDKELNDHFNEACELAFAPCRAFYAEQANIRANHLQQKLEIIGKLDVLLTESKAEQVNWRDIDNQLHKLLKEWRDSGEVDRSEYVKIQPKFNKLVEPLKKSINAFHHDNAEAKQALIEKAKLQLDSEDVFSAINELKSLQHKWQDIGHAGPNKENSLWMSFRKINDKAFAKRNEIKQQEQVQLTAQADEFTSQLTTLNDAVTSAVELKEQQKLLADIEMLISNLKSTKPLLKALLNQAITAENNVKAKIKASQSAAKQQVFVNLFSVMADITSESNLDQNSCYLALPASWQKTVQLALGKESNKEQREQITLELEILANIESPAQFSEQRLAVQVQLLSDKMVQGEEINVTTKLKQWLNCGALLEDEKDLLARVKAVFVKS